MPGIMVIAAHTPAWVFGVLAILVVLGIRGLSERTMTVWRLLAAPAIFIAWGGVGLTQRFETAPALLLDWLPAAVAGLAVGWLTTRLSGFVLDRATGQVRLPGSPVPLVRNLAIFFVKYVLAAASAITPAHAAALMPWDIGVSGLATGYFLGWLARFALKYRGAVSTVAAE